jgi:hypothetical protein
MTNSKEQRLALGQQGPPKVRGLDRLNAELLDQQANHGFERNPVYRKVNPAQRHIGWEPPTRNLRVELEMRCWVW